MILMENSQLYEPLEDTFLIKKHIKDYAYGEVLEIGTGSGILAEEAAQSDKVDHVLAVDIQGSVIEHCKNKIKNQKITFQYSDLFSAIPRKKFDCIIFNPPYLPNDPKIKDIALDGGKKGYEIIERFLDSANCYLKSEGKILLLFSSLSKKNKIDEIIAKNCLTARQIDAQAFLFETLYVYLIEKSQILKQMEENGITDIKKFAKGKRGLIYKGIYKKKQVIIKIKNPQSNAHSTIEFEAEWLKRLNKYNIGPKLFFATEEFLIMEYIDGISFVDFIEKNSKINVQKMIKQLCKHMYLLDKLNMNKQEMTHPQKHIIIRKNKPILIDFERCRYTHDPKNVTQLLQFLMSAQVTKLLKQKNIVLDKQKIQNAAKAYKEKRAENQYKKIMQLLKNE